MVEVTVTHRFTDEEVAAIRATRQVSAGGRTDTEMLRAFALAATICDADREVKAHGA